MTKQSLRTLWITMLFVAASAFAYADTYNVNVKFTDQNTGNGSFTWDGTNFVLVSFVVTGPATRSNFTAAGGDLSTAYDQWTWVTGTKEELDFYNWSLVPNAYVDLLLPVVLTGSNDPVDNIQVGAGYDCPSCSSVASGTVTDTDTVVTSATSAAPEPTSILLLFTAVVGVTFSLRRRHSA